MDVGQLVGVWALRSWRQQYDDGRVTMPFGETPTGMLIYTADGRMSGMIAEGERSRLSGGQWTSPAAERAAAYGSFMAYGGRFVVDGDDIVHHVEISLFPNWVGAEQRRTARLRDDRLLELAGRVEEGTDQARTIMLTWQREESRS
jgi:Lipocalin-like domain